MKLYFSNLYKLHEHIDFLEQSCWLKDFFVVGGVVRDLLLGHKKDIDDVDLTMSGEPNDIWWNIEKSCERSRKVEKGGEKLWKIEKNWEKISLFRTEKFGTMTIVRKDDSLHPIEVKYEITPFREESGYTDNRHPDTIVRSSNLLSDAGRRDFTINAMYYSQIQDSKFKTQNSIYTLDNEQLIKQLKEKWFALIDGILVIQNHDCINNLLPWGKLDQIIFSSFCNDSEINEWDIIWILRDPYQWLQDIIHGKIRCVGKSEKRFTEDALRILRAIRFQNTLNFNSLLNAEFDFDKDTWLGMKKLYYLVKTLSKERIHEEVKKVFSGPNPFGYVAVLDELNILKYVFPHIIGIKKLEQPVRYHPFDVYSHTLLALYHLQSLNSNYLVRIAMLYHDVGKSEQYYTHSLWLWLDDRSYIYGGRLNHVNCGQDMAREDLSKIGFSNKEIEEVTRYIWAHMKPGEILMSKTENRKKKMRELYSSVGYERVKNLLDICKWDRRWHFNPIQKPEIGKVDLLYELLDNLKENEGQFTMNQLAIDGNVLMQELWLEPGKKVGELLKKAFVRVLEDVKGRNEKVVLLGYVGKII